VGGFEQAWGQPRPDAQSELVKKPLHQNSLREKNLFFTNQAVALIWLIATI